MSVAARKKRSGERMKRKREAKAAKRALYASYAGQSAGRSVKSVQPGQFDHETTNCGNPGCDACRGDLVRQRNFTAVAGRLVLNRLPVEAN